MSKILKNPKGSGSDFRLIDLALVIPSFLNNDTCKYLINVYKKNSEKSFQERSLDINGDYKTAKFKALELHPETKAFKTIKPHLHKINEKYYQYLKQFNMFHMPAWNKHFNFAHKFRLLKYGLNDYIHPHIDFDTGTVGSCIINLNSDYAGGELTFFNGEYSIKLNEGDVIIFPADIFWVHEIKPITSGERFSFNCFIQTLTLEQLRHIHYSIDAFRLINDNFESEYCIKHIGKKNDKKYA
jgi:predicted 2-oxoglutarate/Fe(II)-dependent dioxygenase YbiX